MQWLFSILAIFFWLVKLFFINLNTVIFTAAFLNHTASGKAEITAEPLIWRRKRFDFQTSQSRNTKSQHQNLGRKSLVSSKTPFLKQRWGGRCRDAAAALWIIPDLLKAPGCCKPRGHKTPFREIPFREFWGIDHIKLVLRDWREWSYG